MDVKKLSEILMAIGGFLILCAFLWWSSFYGKITKEIGASLGDAVKCLYSSKGECGVASGIAQFAGVTPYNPAVFWIGIAILSAGIILFFSTKKEK